MRRTRLLFVKGIVTILIVTTSFAGLYMWINHDFACTTRACELEKHRRRLLESLEWPSDIGPVNHKLEVHKDDQIIAQVKHILQKESKKQQTHNYNPRVTTTNKVHPAENLQTKLQVDNSGTPQTHNVFEHIADDSREERNQNQFDQPEDRGPHNPTSNCSMYLDNPHQVLNCITGTIIGRVPAELQLQSLHLPHDLKSEDAQSRAESFRDVFANKSWGMGWAPDNHGMGVSGRGATLHWAQELVATLHIIINSLKIKLKKPRISMLDVPCGDMSWMSRFLISRDDIEYTGADIVPDLIAHHNKTYRDFPWTFRVLDIVETSVHHSYDLILNRMMLQHLFLYDAARVLKRLSDSGSHYLMTTTFSTHEENTELSFSVDNPGRFRALNLEIPPFSLGPPLCLQRDGPWTDRIDGWSHFIGVWKLPLRQVRDCDYPYKISLRGSDKYIYTCTDWRLLP